MEQAPKIATDLELAMFLIGHIDNPCEVEVEHGRTENIREFYIREAEKVLTTMTDPQAKELLESKVQEYKNN